MAGVRIQEAASHRLDEIYRYTRDRWGTERADRYNTGLFEAFDKIEARGVMSLPIRAEFGVDGYFFRYQRHFVYWRNLSNGDIGIVTIQAHSPGPWRPWRRRRPGPLPPGGRGCHPLPA